MINFDFPTALKWGAFAAANLFVLAGIMVVFGHTLAEPLWARVLPPIVAFLVIGGMAGLFPDQWEAAFRGE